MKQSMIIAGILGVVALGGAGGLLLAMHNNGDRHHNERYANEMPGHHEGSQTHGMSAKTAQQDHGNHSIAMIANQTQVKLLSKATVAAQTPLSLKLAVQSLQGEAIAEFETFQEKLMHLILVSDDLQVFQHLHPDYQGQGQFVVQAQLPQGGNYTLFSDYKPKDAPEQVSVVQLQAAGSPPPPSDPNLSTQQQVGNMLVKLELPSEGMKEGISQQISFQLKDAVSKKAIRDLQPYLGSQGHLVIVRQSQSLDRANYIHAHALPSVEEGTISFETNLPEPGLYKIWGQFQRNGQVITAPFWIKV